MWLLYGFDMVWQKFIYFSADGKIYEPTECFDNGVCYFRETSDIVIFRTVKILKRIYSDYCDFNTISEFEWEIEDAKAKGITEEKTSERRKNRLGER